MNTRGKGRSPPSFMTVTARGTSANSGSTKHFPQSLLDPKLQDIWSRK